MSMGTYSGVTSVTGTVTSTTTIHDVVSIYNSNSGAGTVTVGTVPAGKKWRIVGIFAMAVDNSLNQGFSAKVTINGVDSLYCYGANGAAAAVGTQCQFIGNYENAIPLAAAQTVTLTTAGAACFGCCTIQYIEETA